MAAQVEGFGFVQETYGDTLKPAGLQNPDERVMLFDQLLAAKDNRATIGRQLIATGVKDVEHHPDYLKAERAVADADDAIYAFQGVTRLQSYTEPED